MRFFLVVNGPLKQARLSYSSREEAEERIKLILEAGFTAWIETEEQAERAQAPLIKPQPKSCQYEGWDI